MTGVRPIMRRAGILAGAAAAGSITLAFAGTPAGAAPPAHRAAAAVGSASRQSPVTEVSRGCGGQNAEVVSAEARPHLVYAAWIGCGGIGFARSTDGGLHFGKPHLMPGSGGFTWDPAITVAANGTLYVAFMRQDHGFMHPVVAASVNHGVSFAHVVPVLPKVKGNWGDRVFIAAGRPGRVYISWDYGPSAAKVRFVCAPSGSCAFSNGDVNAVTQASADGGKTWGPIIAAGPRFPRNGSISSPLLVQPNGRVDMLQWGHFVGKAPSYKIFPGHEVFTSSANGTTWPRHPRTLWPGKGPIAIPVWWIDGDLAADAGGTLYAAWDTQTSAGDIGWLTWSANGGKTWSTPTRVTPGRTRAMHLVEVAGGRRGIAYVGWQTSASPRGYATCIRAYSTTKGWLGKTLRVSPKFGNLEVWPGDTFGMATRPGTGKVSVTWGSAVGGSGNSEIWGAVVTLHR